MNTRTLWAAAATVLAVTVLPACSSDGDTTSDEATTTTSADTTGIETTTATETSGTAQAPVDAAELQTQMDVFFDPAAPVDAKIAVIENGEARTAVITQFNEVLTGYPLTATVGEVNGVDDTTVTAVTEIAGPHGGAPVTLTFTEVDDAWLLADDSTCSVLEMGRLTCE
ncbi:nuclear transport factor 2 family protein [Rhodococcus artemisiae]|uniref:Nuclear transport factor 2 family protein n=1 Tax=Rhodococcus artemisiae TaxID=714159 RepID=A0ABU7L369_9NOCA|nr:nuclear transport factor 2 family protein [Rhodococcus artemisiae]MEE2055978.1 nuclear transport factor 2 family protein [Rhodococcus artemisiae]